MSLDSLEVPQNYKELVPVCQNLDEVLKGNTFRYIFILSLRGSWVRNEDIKRAINTASKLWLGHSILDDDLLHLRSIFKTKELLEVWQKLFSWLQFTWVDSAARKKLRELFSIDAWHGDLTSRSVVCQILEKIYTTLPVAALQAINDGEVEREYGHFSADYPIIKAFLLRKYNITEEDCRITFDYQRRCFCGYFYDSHGDLYGIDELGPTRIQNIIFFGDDEDSDTVNRRDYEDKLQQYLYQRFQIEIHCTSLKKPRKSSSS